MSQLLSQQGWGAPALRLLSLGLFTRHLVDTLNTSLQQATALLCAYVILFFANDP